MIICRCEGFHSFTFHSTDLFSLFVCLCYSPSLPLSLSHFVSVAFVYAVLGFSLFLSLLLSVSLCCVYVTLCLSVSAHVLLSHLASYLEQLRGRQAKDWLVGPEGMRAWQEEVRKMEEERLKVEAQVKVSVWRVWRAQGR